MTPQQQQLLDFKVIRRPILIQGKSENRPFPNRMALIHNKTGYPLDVCSDQYHPHQPQEIAKEIEEATKDVASITDVAVMRGGEQVVLSMKFNQQYQQRPGTLDREAINRFQSIGKDLGYDQRKQARADAGYRVGQTLGRNLYSSGLKISIGNTVGSPCKVIGEVTEIACLNGLLRSGAQAFLITSHRNKSTAVAERILAAIPELRADTEQIVQAREVLTQTPATTETMRAYLLELTDKELWEKVLDKTVADRGNMTPDVQRSYFLDAANSHQEVAWFLLDRISEEGNRLCKRVNQVLTNQPLADGTAGTLWQPYMAATYAIDHKASSKGEFAEDNRKLSATFGQGSRIKVEALEMALTYQQTQAQTQAH